MIEGHIETLTPDGIVHGWVRDTLSPSPCHVQVRYRGQIIAEAMAAIFRADLLQGGHGHGHYGFQARLRHALPPGPSELVLHLPRHGSFAPMAILVPKLNDVQPVAVEALLASHPSWTVDHLLASPGCLDAAGNHRRVGSARFVDAAYRFVLARWPTRSEAGLHVNNLDRSRIGPQDLVLDLLRSRERADLGPLLPSPFDPAFPFTFA
jgi:hypothetical protein